MGAREGGSALSSLHTHRQAEKIFFSFLSLSLERAKGNHKKGTWCKGGVNNSSMIRTEYSPLVDLQFYFYKAVVVLPYLPAPRADPSQETSPYSPCMLQISLGRLYISELIYLYFVIKLRYHREAHQASFGVSPTTSFLAALSHQLSKQSKFPSQQTRVPGAEQSRPSGSSSLPAQLRGWGSITCGRVLRCGRNQNSKLVTRILAHELSREHCCPAGLSAGPGGRALHSPSSPNPTPGRNNFSTAKM